MLLFCCGYKKESRGQSMRERVRDVKRNNSWGHEHSYLQGQTETQKGTVEEI